MKSFLFTSIFFLITIVSAQKTNKEIILENQQPFLVGQITLEALNTNTYQNWYAPNYKAYDVDTETIASIKKELATYKILVFLGTWCGDSKREVPRFVKIMHAAEFPVDNLKIIALDKRKESYKKSPTGEEWGLHITRVPTFIFYKNGKEINRIIESPIHSLETDIKAIVRQEPYSPNYSESMHFD